MILNHSYSIPLTFFQWFLIALLGISCSSLNEEAAPYSEAINQWHAERIASLKERDSWFSLVGLYKLEEGSQTIGSDSLNDHVFPSQAPAQIGTIRKEGTTVSIDVNPEAKVFNDIGQVSQMELSYGNEEETTVLHHGALRWHVIERDGHYFIRLKDTKHPNFESFDGIERFAATPKWRVEATFSAFEEPRRLTIQDISGITREKSLYGLLQFTIQGTEYSIAPIGHPQKDDEFFIVFGDQTNGKSTYSGGRYLYVPTPDENGTTQLDFNKAYNPPCVFTDFATCPLPPSQNQLDVKVTAGEKSYKSP